MSNDAGQERLVANDHIRQLRVGMRGELCLTPAPPRGDPRDYNSAVFTRIGFGCGMATSSSQGRRLPYAAVEGVDGSGKSSLGVALAGQGLTVMESPGIPYDLAKEGVLEHADGLSRFLFFAAANCHVARSPERPEIIIRHIWSTIAYSYAAGLWRSERSLAKLAVEVSSMIELPSPVFHIRVSRQQQHERLKRRTDESRSQKPLGGDALFQQRLQDGFELAYLWLGTQPDVLDSDAFTTAELVSIVLMSVRPSGST